MDIFSAVAVIGMFFFMCSSWIATDERKAATIRLWRVEGDLIEARHRLAVCTFELAEARREADGLRRLIEADGNDPNRPRGMS